MIEQYLDEAQMLRDAGDFARAAEACAKAIEIDQNDHRAHFLLGLIAVAQTQHKNAANHFAETLRLDPDNVDALLNYGMSLSDFGEFDKARDCYRRAIEIKPDFSPGYYNLFNITKIAADDPQIPHLENLIRNGISDQFQESLAHFSLGKAYDDIGEWDKAFGNYLSANELQGKVYDHQNTLTMFGRAKETFTRELIEKHKGLGNKDRTPIFIIGMPRSGSSLVEDLLCRNENIVGYGERTEVAQIVVRLENTHPSHTPYPEIVEQISGEQFDKLGELYLQLLAQVMPTAERVVDKNILNHSVAGFIRLLFCNAAIIHTVRDPIDTCMSCFFQNFKSGLEYSFDLDHLGKRYAAYADLMDHWNNVLGDGLFTMQYEELVRDKESHISRLFDHVGMPAPTGAAVETPADRPIATASAWQARQPIYDTSIGRWKNYEKHLGPLFEAFEEGGFNYQQS